MWDEEPITALQPRPVGIWLSSRDLSPKSRGQTKNFSSFLFPTGPLSLGVLQEEPNTTH